MSVWCLVVGSASVCFQLLCHEQATRGHHLSTVVRHYTNINIFMYYTLILLHMYLLCFKACHAINIIKANSRTSRFDGGKNRGWLFNEYGDPILVRSVSPCWLQESNVSLLLWPSSVSTWGDVLDLALEKALKKQKLSEDVEASKRYWLRRGLGGNIQGI